jgi:hypothetical protein
MTANDICSFDFAIRTDDDFDFNRADQSHLLCDFGVSWRWLGNRFSRFLAGYARSSRAYENGSAKALFQSHTVPPKDSSFSRDSENGTAQQDGKWN